MTTKITEKPPGIPEHPVINLPTAVGRIRAWLNVVKQLPPFSGKPEKVPRALYIADEDFVSMLAECRSKYHDYQIKGVRIYFGLKPADDDPDGPADTLCGMMVPVLHKDKSKRPADALYTNLDQPDPNDTSIYDFTTPCPAYCDLSSELFVTD